MYLESRGKTVELGQLLDSDVIGNWFSVEIIVSLAVAVGGGSCRREFVRVSMDVAIAGLMLIGSDRRI